MSTLPQCVCSVAGWCERYKRQQNARLHQICSGTCPPENPCTEELRAKYLAKWARLASAENLSAGMVQAVAEWTPPPPGPGTAMKALLVKLGMAEQTEDCNECNRRALQMDVWGVAGCKEHRHEIIGWLRIEESRKPWWQKRHAEMRAVLSGVAFQLNWDDPIPSLVDLAIHLAEFPEQ